MATAKQIAASKRNLAKARLKRRLGSRKAQKRWETLGSLDANKRFHFGLPLGKSQQAERDKVYVGKTAGERASNRRLTKGLGKSTFGMAHTLRGKKVRKTR